MMPLFLIEETIEEAALVIADRLRRLADGALNDPETWLRVCTRIDCRAVTYDVPGAGRGEFAPYPGPTPPCLTGVIAINMAYPPDEVCRAWVHELAHAELHRWHPPQLEEAKDSWMYEGAPEDVRHRIARRVEVLILGHFGDKVV
ncbi:MAG: hypothetical protein SFU56_19480 [Capsulimonadales bacterium]|nr:hypothetical protein [Capsulimonadales bacterium]